MTSPITRRAEGRMPFRHRASWAEYDNHHYGAAARIRFFLDTGEVRYPGPDIVAKYAPYRKGTRSAKRREIDAVAA